MKNPKSINLFSLTTLGVGAALILACGKKTEEPELVEAVPTFSTEYDSDTSASLPTEPSLQAVGESSGSGFESESEKYSAQQAQFSDRGAFVVQVSVFKSRRQAENFMTRLADNGFPAYVAQVENPTYDLPGTYHRVRIGRFGSIAAAKQFGESTLAPMGYSYWVDNKSNDQVGAGSAASSGYESSDSYSTPTGNYYSDPAPTESYSTPSEPSSYTPTPSEPAAPSSSPWDTPSEPAPATTSDWGTPSEPAATTSDWGTPSEPAATTSDWGTMPTPAEPETPKDTSFNEGGFLDEW